MLSLQLTVTELVAGCIGGLESVEKWLEEAKAAPTDLPKLEKRLTNSIDYVKEVQRRLKELLDSGCWPPLHREEERHPPLEPEEQPAVPT